MRICKLIMIITILGFCVNGLAGNVFNLRQGEAKQEVQDKYDYYCEQINSFYHFLKSENIDYDYCIVSFVKDGRYYTLPFNPNAGRDITRTDVFELIKNLYLSWEENKPHEVN